jgi:polyisoprenoid-binding protein YceI
MSTATAIVIPTGTYSIDPSHSTVEFAVRHMGIATVRGKATEFEGTIESTGDTLAVDGSVQVASITTQNGQRDEHLASPDFFDVERFPQISFRSNGVEISDDGSVRISGEITIKGVTREIELTGTFAGAGTDPWGNERIGLDVSGAVDRRDFDLTWNQPLAGGGLLVSNEVKLELSASAVKA